ncbi:1,2-phenylacetyl-CoA epoxidase subunit PaaC [Saccharothrix syringae]|uniref:Phenylacetate-CoA oxygenase subunit PaaI n=1 Tax=Saccharothrix syringae TaxID=103733 RepID=A0A5Q0GWB2_SACSY|nr:1,2-phenylacetyl-CoA epoxidase subunit PaaC [Saccharothrix syringae]QFZ17794.1 phenylacetate-CoA oxygenase subunit PaaI [Saccharothrix syringae]
MNADARYVLRLGDDALIAAQRLVQWCTRAPELEEDVALANIAADLLGQARALLALAGQEEGAGRDEDDLAYLRDESEFGNALLVELDNGDFAVTTAKLLFFAAYQNLLYRALSAVAHPVLAGIAAKAVKETAYHVEHAALWAVRLGDGTDESHRRMQAAVDEVWPYTHELFTPDEVTRAAASAVDPAALRPDWSRRIGAVLAEATLRRPEDGWAPAGGRAGAHTEAFGYLVGEMQVLHRAHPGVRW